MEASAPAVEASAEARLSAGGKASGHASMINAAKSP